jgi:triacylglycerol lipase
MKFKGRINFFMHAFRKSFFWLKSFPVEFLVFLATFFLIPLLSRCQLKWKKKPNIKEGNVHDKTTLRGPIILIHGYLHHAFVWIYHGMKFSKKGFGPIYTLNLKKTFGSILDHVDDLDKMVKKVLKETNGEEVILIGHSMGGLIASYFALNVAKKKSVNHVITLGTPLKGTYMARFGFGKCAKEMSRDSSFIKELNEKITNEKEINFYHIATKNDELVIPYNSAILGDDEKKHLILNGVGHGSLLYSKRVNDKISFWLTKYCS